MCKCVPSPGLNRKGMGCPQEKLMGTKSGYCGSVNNHKSITITNPSEI